MSKVWSSGERVGKAPSADLRSRSFLESRSTVIRRSGAARPSFSRRNENPSWGDPLPRSAFREAVDFVLFAGVFVGVALLALHVAMGRVG